MLFVFQILKIENKLLYKKFKVFISKTSMKVNQTNKWKISDRSLFVVRGTSSIE